MRVIIQRVAEASVTVHQEMIAHISKGLLILVGIEPNDSIEDIHWLCQKIVQCRIFNDAQGVMNLSVMDIQGELLVVSQFTLHASVKKGNRPSYIRAAKPEIAIPLYEQFVQTLRQSAQRPVQTGIFGADMKVALWNDGPVTIWMDSKNKE